MQKKMPELNYFRHPQAIVESSTIGSNTRIWAFSHILRDAVIGAECNICDHTFVENDVVVGDRVTIKCGVQLWDGIRIEDDVFVGPNVTFTNDPYPRSQQHLGEYPRTIVQSGASIGANATILPGVTVGRCSMVGAGTVVTRSVPAYAVVVGNPARIVRYTDDTGARLPTEQAAVASAGGAPEVRVKGVALLCAPLIKDLRGSLSAREVNAGLPFVPNRYFVVMDVPTKEVRGEHAHRKCEQLLICLKGAISCVADDGNQRQEFLLDSPELALYLPPMVWGVQYKYTSDAILLVMASEPYDADDYIRDYEKFRVERLAYDGL